MTDRIDKIENDIKRLGILDDEITFFNHVIGQSDRRMVLLAIGYKGQEPLRQVEIFGPDIDLLLYNECRIRRQERAAIADRIITPE